MAWRYFPAIASLFLVSLAGVDGGNRQVIEIGAITDVNSTIGKEERIAMMVAVQWFNDHSKSYELSLHFRSPSGGPLQSAYAAEELIKKKKVKVILGMDRWEEAAAVADVASQAQVPVISFSAPAVTPPSARTRWPFLVTMARNETEQMKCIATILRSYNWRRVVPVYEDDVYGGDSGKLTPLTDAINEARSEVEHRLVLPPFSSLSDPKEAIQQELYKIQEIKSRVFIVLQTSLPMVVHLFREAKEARLMETDMVWILTDTVASFLDLVNTSVIYSMEGALGVRSYYLDNSSSYNIFRKRFIKLFRSEYQDEDIFEPGFSALKAYDSITTVIEALERIPGGIVEPKRLLNQILSSNFTGLTGQIHFQESQLSGEDSILRVVNVVGKRYKELDFWLPGFGFSKKIFTPKVADGNATHDPLRLAGQVSWPGEPKWVPKGWAMPTADKKMIIGVPGRTSFEKFVKVIDAKQNKYDGFCIELFDMVVDLLDYPLNYIFEPYNGTYDDLVDHVYNKTYDAIVGDVTVLANRSDKVEFTQPYLESGLALIVPAKSEESAWMFTKAFTPWMWLTTAGILIYTMLVVWFLERQSNPDFNGSWKDEISVAIMFTFSSLFFAHREKLYNNLTKVVLVVWLFVVLILTSSYTASLTSMLTIRQLQPNITDIDWLARNNLRVGCDGDSFVRNLLENVLNFEPENVRNVSSQDAYPGEFKSGNISAAFLELPYEKVFMNQYCKGFTAITPAYRFGGLGFVFQKGSPIGADVSKAILDLLENGKLKSLEDKWFAPSKECSSNSTDNVTGSLGLRSFWGLYVISAATSTICLLIFLIISVRKYLKYQENIETQNATPASRDDSVWDKTVKLARFVYHGEEVAMAPTPSAESTWPSPVMDSARHSNSSWVNLNTFASPEIGAVGHSNHSRTSQ